MNPASREIPAALAASRLRRALCQGALVAITAMLSSALPATAQDPGTQQKLAAIKQSIAENRQKLAQYQWVENTQLALKGDAKPATQSMCRYGPDGKVIKTPMGSPPAQQQASGGRLKQKVIANKKDEMQEYMERVKNLLGLYLPPDPQKMQDAAKAGNLSVNSAVGSGTASLVFKNYAVTGDQMTLSFNTAAKKIADIQVKSLLDDKDPVTLSVQFASLPDGANYVQQTILDVPGKKLQVTTTSSNYQPVSGGQ